MMTEYGRALSCKSPCLSVKVRGKNILVRTPKR